MIKDFEKFINESSTENAKDKYRELSKEIIIELNKLNKLSSYVKKTSTNPNLNWDDVGDIGSILNDLKAINKQLGF